MFKNEYSYNQAISNQLLDSIHAMNHHLAQPTMFGGRENSTMSGGKRHRKYVLPGSTDYDYPGTLSVGHLGNKSTPASLGKAFWKDFGEKEFFEDEPMVAGAIQPKKILKSVKKGLQTGLEKTKDFGEDVSDYAKRNNVGRKTKNTGIFVAKEVAKEAAKQGIKAGLTALMAAGKGGSISGKMSKGFSKVGDAVGKVDRWGERKHVGQKAANVGKAVGKEIAKEAAKQGIKAGLTALMAAGKPVQGREELRRYVEHLQQVGGQSKGSKMRGMFGAYMDGNYPNFNAKKIGNPSKDVKARFLKKKIPERLDTPANKAKEKLKDILSKDKNERISPAVKTYLTKTKKTFADNETVLNLIERVEKKFKITSKGKKFSTSDFRAIDNATFAADLAVANAREKDSKAISKAKKAVKAALAKKKGGVLLRSAVQPMDGGFLMKSRNQSSVLPPGLQSDTGGKDAYGRGKPAKKPSARGAIVKEVMQKMGMSLPEASKYVKDNGLY